MSDTTHPRSPMTKGRRQTITPPTPEVTRPVPEQPSVLGIGEQGASRLIVRQHGGQEEKNEFEELVSTATSLQGSKPAQVLTLEWRKPHTDGHRVAGSDISWPLVGEPDNDSRIAAFWKPFSNVLKWYQYADSLLGNLSGWEARINLAI